MVVAEDGPASVELLAAVERGDADESSVATTFSDVEWRALVPMAMDSWPNSKHGPAADARLKDPSTPAQLDCAAHLLLAPESTYARLAAFALRLPGCLLAVSHGSWCASMAALFAPVWVFNPGLFGFRQLLAGTIASTLVLAIHHVPHWTFYWSPYFSKLRPPDIPTDPVASIESLIRYRQLVASGATKLLDHEDLDPMCPCPAPGCGGGPLKRGRYVGYDIVMGSLFLTTYLTFGWSFSMTWTPLHTVGTATWSTPWSLVLALWFLCSATIYTLTVSTHAIGMFNAVSYQIERRLQSRAVELVASEAASLCEELVSRAVSLLQKGANDAPVEAVGHTGELSDAAIECLFARFRAPDSMIYLHSQLTDAWRYRTSSLELRVRHIALGMLAELFLVAVNLATGSCVTAHSVFAIGLASALIFHFLALVAFSNRGIEAAAASYRRARTRIRAARADISACPAAARDPRTRSAVLDALRSYDDVLGGMLEAEDARGRFVGVPVTGGLLRTVAVTGVTLAVAIYGVLKGWAFFTLEVICPFS
ncbi:hypothetical protein DFJ74DRAFT_700918 [Hyaloraphidium curvatum]|nr:hypothetical protein DFJ74DRAFT_700918 [Hyaloraphidium curvatum]